MIELQIRMVDDFTTDEIRQYSKEWHDLQLTEGDESSGRLSEEEVWNSKRKFVYRPMILPLDYCIPFSKYDSKHIILNYGELSFIAKDKYEDFRAIYESLSGEKIRFLEEFKVDRQIPPAK